jgi:hypothetical protein
MNYYLYLDFDGVLHPDEARVTSPFFFLGNFCDAVRSADPKGKLKIVISSTWRLRHAFDDLIIQFPMDIAIRIVGVTPKLEAFRYHLGSRQREIEAWMEFDPKGKWLAIDDKRGLFDNDCENLFHVPYTDASLEADMRAAAQPFSDELKAMFRQRKRLNRSTGLTDATFRCE